jgi:hypothetical protein
MSEEEALSRLDNSSNPFTELSEIDLWFFLGVPHFDKNLYKVEVKFYCPIGATN